MTIFNNQFTDEKWENFLRGLKDTHKKIHYGIKKEHIRELYIECGLSFNLLKQISDKSMAILLNSNPDIFKKLTRTKKVTLDSLFSVSNEQEITEILCHVEAVLHFLHIKDNTLEQFIQLTASEREAYFLEFEKRGTLSCHLL